MLNRFTKVAIAFTVLLALNFPCSPAEAQLIPYWRILPWVIRSKQFKPLRLRLQQQIVKARLNGKLSLPRLKKLQGHRTTERSPLRSGE